MKKIIALIICMAIACSGSAAFAEESPAPDSTPQPTPTLNPIYNPSNAAAEPFSGLIAISALQNATNEDVVRVQIRLRDLCYFPFKQTGNYQRMTADAAKAFQLKHTMDDGTPMIADGTIGSQTMDILFRHNVSRSDITANITVGTSQVSGKVSPGELINWSEVKGMLALGSSYLVTDYNSGTSFYLVYTGGENHAEMECKDAFDASVLRDVFGGEYSFFKRAVVVSINGKQIAASLQGYPHGTDEYAQNDMSGHVCLFFGGSLSHVGSLPDAEHQELVYKAAGR